MNVSLLIVFSMALKTVAMPVQAISEDSLMVSQKNANGSPKFRLKVRTCNALQYLFGRISKQTFVFWWRQQYCYAIVKNTNTNHHLEIDITLGMYSALNESWLSCSQGDLLLQEQNFAVNCENHCTMLKMIQWILLHTI